MDAAPRILVSHAAPEAYAPMARALMAKLGYEIVLPEEFEAIAEANDLERPAVRIVDERQLAEVPDEFDPAPIVVLSGEHGVTGRIRASWARFGDRPECTSCTAWCSR